MKQGTPKTMQNKAWAAIELSAPQKSRKRGRKFVSSLNGQVTYSKRNRIPKQDLYGHAAY